jgi:poly-gamma-glutamate capsule biosynthesis protein CapA/YwtB (metallophosphatase superfamily)
MTPRRYAVVPAILDGPLSRPLPLRCRRWTEETALRAMRFRTGGGELLVGPGTPSASLVAVGDISMHFVAEAASHTRPSRLFDGVAPVLRAADLRVGNLESVLTTERRRAALAGSFLRGAPELVEALTAAQFDAVTCANNHCLDFGPAALCESLDHLRRHGIQPCGVGSTDAQQRAPVFLSARGISVGMLGYADDCNVAPRWPIGPRPAETEDEAILADVRRLREQVDIVVLQLHWGYEWAMYPLRTHRDRARRFAEAGADIVLCHHAHVPMGVEAWKGSVIAHGLGNFLFGWRRPRSHPWRNRAHMLRVHFNADGVTSAEVIPCGTGRDHRVVTLQGVECREVLGAHQVLRRGLRDDAYLVRLEADRIVRETQGLVLRLGRFAVAGDAGRVQELALHLGTPRQRALVGALRSGEFDGGPDLALFLDRVACARQDWASAVAVGREAAAEPITGLLRRLTAGRHLRGEPVGRVP